MDKLKYIKFEESQGQYTNSIPIGVDSKNVDLKTGNNLEDVLGDYDISKGTIEERFTDFNTDKTLTLENMPADAASVGNKIQEINERTEGYVTPENFGAKGDGITDDTAAIQKALKSGSPVVFHKNYLISAPIIISTTATINGNHARIKVSDNFIGESAIIINSGVTTRMKYIYNLYIDCNAKNIIGIFINSKRISLQDCIVQFCGGSAYYIEDAGGSHIINCHATNTGPGSKEYSGTEFSESIALKNNSADVYIDTFDFIDFHIGIEHIRSFGFYNNIHGFILRYLENIWLNSCFFKTSANYTYGITIINSYPDSQQYDYIFQGHGAVHIIGGVTFTNDAVWDGLTRRSDNTYICSISGDIKCYFDLVTLKGSNDSNNLINFTDNPNKMPCFFINNCDFINVNNNLDSIALTVPDFEGRTYTKNELKMINDDLLFKLEFQFSPETQGAITDNANFHTQSSLNYVGRIPNLFVNAGFNINIAGIQIVNGFYTNATSGNNVTIYPLIVYLYGPLIYIRPLPTDNKISNPNDSNTYYVFINGSIKLTQ